MKYKLTKAEQETVINFDNELDANSVMSRSTVTRHIHISVPRRRPEIPFKERRIDLFLSPKAKVQWRDNTSLGIFVAAYRTVWSIG